MRNVWVLILCVALLVLLALIGTAMISTARIEELMTELRNDYTLVVVTHNMQQAARIADATAFFSLAPIKTGSRAGVLVEFGPTTQLFSNPTDSRTDDYVQGRFG